MGDDWRGWKNGKYDNRYKGNRRRSRKNHNKAYVGIAIAGVAILIWFVIYDNYDITVNNQKLGEIIRVEALEQTFDDIYKEMKLESVQNSIDEMVENMPIKIEPKQQTLEEKLKDCSIYKKEYLESYKGVKSTPDNTAAMMGDALTGVQQTRACEEYNRKVLTEAGVLGHCRPPLTLDLKTLDEEAHMSYKERFIKYCGQEEWDYLNKQ